MQKVPSNPQKQLDVFRFFRPFDTHFFVPVLELPILPIYKDCNDSRPLAVSERRHTVMDLESDGFSIRQLSVESDTLSVALKLGG